MAVVEQIATVLRNRLNAALGRKQKLVELIESQDIVRLMGKLDSQREKVAIAMKQYNPKTHEIMSRPEKVDKQKDGKKRARLPIPYQKVINRQATAFLFGGPVQFSDISDVDYIRDDSGELQAVSRAKDAFAYFKSILDSTRFDSNMRDCKTRAGSETISAKLYHIYLGEDNELHVLVKVLAKSLGDDLYYKFDDYGRLIMFGRYFTIDDDEGNDEIHFDLYTSEYIYRCTQRAIGWEVEPEINIIKMIPVMMYQEDTTEWDDVQRLIERRESIQSNDADVNDYVSNPKVVANGLLQGTLKADDPLQIIQTEQGGDVKYLTYDTAPESRKRECDTLESFIYGMTYSVNPSSDVIKEMKIPSGVSWEYMFMFPMLKAKDKQDYYGAMIDREINLVKAITGVLHPEVISNGQLDQLKVGYQFSTPMPNNIESTLDAIQKSKDMGAMSQETAVYQNPLIKDPKTEIERLRNEEAERKTNNIFDPTV